jgi:hypothetical protein
MASALVLGAAVAGAQQPGTGAPAAGSPSQDTAAMRTAVVTSLAGTTVYINAGRADGLVEGMEVTVIRHDSAAATLRVAFLASRQAACEIVRGAADVVIGETVRYYAKLSPTGAGQVAATAPRRAPRRLSGPGIHGRVGGRYLRAEETPLGAGFDQPSLDLRLDGLALGGTPVGLAVDLRTRRTTTSQADGTSRVDGHTRVYQAAVLWHAPGARFRLAAGRQYLTAVTSVSLFDGALIEFNGSHVTVGAFGGVEPEPANLDFSDETQDAGGYFQVHNRPGARTTWSITTGAVASYTRGKANREFAFAQAGLSSPVLSIYALQELDYYRPWKVRQGEDAFSPTSTYLSGSIRPTRWLALNGSYDDRRSVRLYRDAVDPATAFDDSYREGVGGGLSLLGYRVRVSGEVRRSTGGAAGDATSYTTSAGIDRLTALRLSLTGRGTWYSSSDLTGQLYTMRIGIDPLSTLHVDLNGGVRAEDNPVASASRRTFTWYGADLDVYLARAWFLSFSGHREEGPESTISQFYGSVTWRF